MSAKNLRNLVRLTCNRKTLHSRQHVGSPLHIAEAWPSRDGGTVVYMRGRPRDGIYVTERLETVERRVRDALGALHDAADEGGS